MYYAYMRGKHIYHAHLKGKIFDEVTPIFLMECYLCLHKMDILHKKLKNEYSNHTN